MHEQIVQFLTCPICRAPLVFEGRKSSKRFVNGYFKCSKGHIYQVKEEIGLLKDARFSVNEFEWKVDVADEKRYEEIRKQYSSYLREDQKIAMKKLMEKLVNHVVKSCEESDNKVLDVATGMGGFILPLAEESSEDLIIIGTDIDEKPLRGAMNKAKKTTTYHKISLIVTDAKHLCFKGDVFSTISSNFGFDNVPDTLLAFNESARILQPEGKIIFSSIWFKVNSESMRLAEERHLGQMASETRLRETLRKVGLVLEWIEEIYCGVWPHNPMDLLPVEGDEYTHMIAQARKPKN
ncbi:MAG: class I SAM-dependent methyltransferase [Candidatus Bathyarchaeota archaeon]|nr:class I SAM-dependent methyltransferase [Candidatus Bathyarchaeota archaeon]MDH5746502.1 class I SAM-dependent methyltransferase [Candidatus Bathyarchaeota archaeon]